MNYCDNKIPNVLHIRLETEKYTHIDENDFLENKESSSIGDVVDEVIDEIVIIENVTAKFRISDTQVIAQVYPNRLHIGDIKKDLARKFEIDENLLCLLQNDKEIYDECLLLETCSNEFGIHEFMLGLNVDSDDCDSDTPALDLTVYYNKHRLPDFITVNVSPEDSQDGQGKSIIVEIQNRAIEKPLLCCYRSKETGLQYQDAFTQTGPQYDYWKYRRYYSRDTQTHEYKEKLMDTMHDQMSQCYLDGNNVRFDSKAHDYTLKPGKYQTYAQKMRMENRLEKIKLIQRNWRRFIIVRFMKRAAAEYRMLVANREAEEKEFELEKLERIKLEERAKQFPRTKDDFDMLYSEVQKWKIAELKRIASMYDGPSRIAEVNLLLDKEINLLNGIHRQRDLVSKSMEDYRNNKLLTNLGKPIKWIGYKDMVIHLDLLRTQRVRFLHEIYNDLQMTLSPDKRIELIKKVKEILCNEQDYPDFSELFDLFDREKNLLIYTKHCDVTVLRKRQNLLFLELIKFSKDEIPRKVKKRLCEVCKQVKSYDKFAVRTRQNIVNTCNSCYYLKTPSSENTIYKSILRSIQREERKKQCNASFAFLLQVDDIRHIVDLIWHGHSILSKKDNIKELRLPRWIKSDDWSPWNCICLTENEARDHYQINDLEKVYDKKLILEVGNKHKLGRSSFHKLAAAGTEFLETGQWFDVGMNQQRTPDFRIRP